MYKIDIKEALYPIGVVLVVHKKLSKTSVFIDRKWPIWPNFFLMNVFFALKGSKHFIIISSLVSNLKPKSTEQLIKSFKPLHKLRAKLGIGHFQSIKIDLLLNFLKNY